MNKKMRNFIFQYWSTTKLGKDMLASDFVSYEELWFLIPNNIKRINGFHASRIRGKKKRINKNRKRNLILSFKLFDLINETIDSVLSNAYKDSEFFNKFVDIKNKEW